MARLSIAELIFEYFDADKRQQLVEIMSGLFMLQ
jgi:hypothetical protein